MTIQEVKAKIKEREEREYQIMEEEIANLRNKRVNTQLATERLEKYIEPIYQALGKMGLSVKSFGYGIKYGENSSDWSTKNQINIDVTAESNGAFKFISGDSNARQKKATKMEAQLEAGTGLLAHVNSYSLLSSPSLESTVLIDFTLKPSV
jgi:hypothetical protein